jgi:hypothetical protein
LNANSYGNASKPSPVETSPYRAVDESNLPICSNFVLVHDDLLVSQREILAFVTFSTSSHNIKRRGDALMYGVISSRLTNLNKNSVSRENMQENPLATQAAKARDITTNPTDCANLPSPMYL